jgi:hypothetical protein
MSQSFVNPTYYNLQKAVLKFEFTDNQRDLDITALIPSISLNASTNSETMFGSFRVIDSVGLLEETPLRGEEQITFEFVDSKIMNENGGIQAGAVLDPYKFTGFVYKIDNVTIKDTNDGIYYDIHFISYQSYKAGTHEITRPFRDVKISSIAQTIFDDYFDNNSDGLLSNNKPYDKKKLILEETSGNTRCIIPAMRAEEAMEFLTKRSYSAADSPSCTYRFFESSRGYNFVTDEHLFRLAEDENNIEYDKSRLFNFTYHDAIPNTLEFFDAQLNNLDNIENTQRINSLDDLYNGAYRNQVIELDILRRQTNLLNNDGQYNYFDERDKYFKIGNNQQLQDKHTEKFIASSHRGLQTSGRDEDIQKKFLVVVNYDKNGDSTRDVNSLPSETYYADIISNRQAYTKHLEGTTVSASGPGRLDITAGDIIDLDVDKFQQADGTNRGLPEQNKHLSGRYIVKSVNHRMEQDEMKNYYVMVKKDWSNVGLLNTSDVGPR